MVSGSISTLHVPRSPDSLMLDTTSNRASNSRYVVTLRLPFLSLPMHQEYRLSKKLALVLIPGLMAIGLLPWLFLERAEVAGNLLFLITWLALWALMAAFAAIEYFRWKLTVDTYEVTLQSTFSKRSLRIEQIKGYRLLPHGIVLEPNEPGMKPLKIGTYFTGEAIFSAWVTDKFQDLSALEMEETKAVWLQDEVLGETEFQRESRMDAYKWLTGVLAVAVYILLFVSLFFEHAIIPTLLLPFVCFWLINRSNGWVNVELKKGKGSSSLTLALFMSGVSVALCAAIKLPDLVDWRPLLPWYIAGALLVFVPFIYIQNKVGYLRQAPAGLILYGLFLAVPYGIGLSQYLNYEGNTPQVKGYFSIITGKNSTSGKTTSYYLKFFPVGPLKDTTEVSVGSAQYEATTVGDKVVVAFGNGALGATWFYIAR